MSAAPAAPSRTCLPMDKHFSLYLDAVRFLAAAMVVVSHYLGFGVIGPSVQPWVPDFGREAVIVFFVLSGYVIAYTTSTKRHSLREYAIARCARIYSACAPVLLIAFATVFIAVHAGSSPILAKYTIDKAYLYIPFHLLFLGELWNLSEVPPWLGSYWSLGFEVWYYVLFGAAFYLKGVTRILAVTLILAIMGHKLWLLAPVWLVGVLLFNMQHRVTPVRRLHVSDGLRRLPCFLPTKPWISTSRCAPRAISSSRYLSSSSAARTAILRTMSSACLSYSTFSSHCTRSSPGWQTRLPRSGRFLPAPSRYIWSTVS